MFLIREQWMFCIGEVVPQISNLAIMFDNQPELEEDVPINLPLQPTTLPAMDSEDVQEYGGIGEITAAPSSVLPTGTIRRRPTRMKFKGVV